MKVSGLFLFVLTISANLSVFSHSDGDGLRPLGF